MKQIEPERLPVVPENYGKKPFKCRFVRCAHPGAAFSSGWCSFCHGAAKDGVKILGYDVEYFAFACIRCARRIGSAAGMAVTK